ncbi:MAG: dacB 2 [Anaerosporomusa subterranea]|nr:dacB 2 [Anaerosporomusa subterranea]
MMHKVKYKSLGCKSIVLAFFYLLLLPTLSEAVYLIPPPIEAEAAIIMDAETKTVLYEKEPDKRMFPASTTKIMTFMLAQKLGSLDSTVTVSSKAAGCEGSSLELSKGDQINLRGLLYGLMLVSGNDAAEAVAEHIGGSIPQFVRQMNDEAASIGARNTRFVNPHGLPDPRHYTTAYDLALITAQALRNPEFSKVSSTKSTTITFINGKTRRLDNTNKLLGAYRGINGGKTGYTEAAGDCLVVTAKRGGVQLIVVVLNDDGRWADARSLLDFGFAQRGIAER